GARGAGDEGPRRGCGKGCAPRPARCFWWRWWRRLRSRGSCGVRLGSERVLRSGGVQGEFGPPAQPELRVDAGEVVLDGLDAEEQLLGGLAVGPARRHDGGHRAFLRRESGVTAGPGDVDTACAPFPVTPLDVGVGAELLVQVAGGAEGEVGLTATAGAAEGLAEPEVDAGGVVRHGEPVEVLETRVEDPDALVHVAADGGDARAHRAESGQGGPVRQFE